jgi:hypothetical protein
MVTGVEDMDDTRLAALRDYAWKYFDRHAEQRLKTLHFYLLLSVALAGAIAATRGGRSPEAAWPLGILLVALSLIFWLLDRRNRHLIKQAERSLRWLERELGLPGEDGKPHPCLLFEREAHDTDALPRHALARFTYTKCFQLLFLLFGIGGLAMAAL